MIRYILTLLILITTSFVSAAVTWNKKENELYTGCGKAMSMRDFDDLVSYAVRLEDEAKKSGNSSALRIGKALRMRGDISRHNNVSVAGAADSLEKVLPDLCKIRDDKALWRELFHIHSGLAFYYLYVNLDYSKASHYSFKALENAEKLSSDVMKVDALNLLSAIYALKEDPAGLSYAEKSEKISRKTGNLSGQYTALVNLSNYLYNEGKHRQSLDYLNKALLISEKIQLKGEYTYLYSFLGDIYHLLGDNDKAQDFFRKAIEAKSYSTYYDIGYALLRYSAFSAQTGDLQRALTLVLSAKDFLKDYPDVNYRPNLLQHIAQVYEALGRYREALDTYKQYSELNSRLITTEKEKAFSILELKYRISEHENKEKQLMLDNAVKQRNYMLIVFLCVLLFITAAFMAVMHYRNRQYYRRTIETSLQSLEREKAENTRLLESIRKRDSEDEEANEKTERRIDEIYGQLLILMEKEKPYRDSTLSIERTAEMLGTNRTYLSKVINNRAGCSYSVFINKARINEAVELLSECGSDVSVKEVAFKVGFSSLSYFNSIFKQMIGVSPGVFKTQGQK